MAVTEPPRKRVSHEAELLRSGTLSKRLAVLHCYMLTSDADHIAHRKLWSFLVDRMTGDLAANGVSRPESWDAQLITDRKDESLGERHCCERRDATYRS